MAKQESPESGTLQHSIFVDKNRTTITVHFPDSIPDISSPVVDALRQRFSCRYRSKILEITLPEGSHIDELWGQACETIVETLGSLDIDPAVRDE